MSTIGGESGYYGGHAARSLICSCFDIDGYNSASRMWVQIDPCPTISIGGNLCKAAHPECCTLNREKGWLFCAMDSKWVHNRESPGHFRIFVLIKWIWFSFSWIHAFNVLIEGYVGYRLVERLDLLRNLSSFYFRFRYQLWFGLIHIFVESNDTAK